MMLARIFWKNKSFRMMGVSGKCWARAGQFAAAAGFDASAMEIPARPRPPRSRQSNSSAKERQWLFVAIQRRAAEGRWDGGGDGGQKAERRRVAGGSARRRSSEAEVHGVFFRGVVWPNAKHGATLAREAR